VATKIISWQAVIHRFQSLDNTEKSYTISQPASHFEDPVQNNKVKITYKITLFSEEGLRIFLYRFGSENCPLKLQRTLEAFYIIMIP
jgi:hypothetical protein